MSELRQAFAASAPRILTLDIETAPHVADVWGLFQQNVSLNRLREVSRVLCFAAKWYDRRSVEFYSEHHDGRDVMIENAWRLLDEADILVTYNGVGFDVKHLQREFVEAGMSPPAPWRNVDLLRTVRREFKFASGKLAHVADRLGIGGKVPHTGHDMWTRVMAADEKAWALFKKYCVQDVRLTERLYDELGGRGWIKDHPHFGLYLGVERCCPSCGSEELEQRGWHRTQVTTYALMRCRNCGAHSRLTHVKARTSTRPAR